MGIFNWLIPIEPQCCRSGATAENHGAENELSGGDSIPDRG